MWASFRIACNGWSPEIPKTRFRGPFTGNTSFPMLIIGNTADPLSPLSSAKTVSQNFPGSVLVTQDYPGHTTIFVVSNCTAQAVREYFVNGVMPEEGTICSVDGSPFDPPEVGSDSVEGSTPPQKRGRMFFGGGYSRRALQDL
ncbi:hypothetical protein V5O48_011936 [Marasmius crinis-equi]|uniref:Peptidase S33 tripeptidyl aminopeptidase-like C-terminal domain-containing protein n=1 Tax=Marasmius crinis-equi TaxID=585013 RepID=A0ABR3F465_9AGAR